MPSRLWPARAIVLLLLSDGFGSLFFPVPMDTMAASRDLCLPSPFLSCSASFVGSCSLVGCVVACSPCPLGIVPRTCVSLLHPFQPLLVAPRRCCLILPLALVCFVSSIFFCFTSAPLSFHSEYIPFAGSYLFVPLTPSLAVVLFFFPATTSGDCRPTHCSPLLSSAFASCSLAVGAFSLASCLPSLLFWRCCLCCKRAMAQAVAIADLKKTTPRPMLLARVLKVWRASYARAANPFGMNFVLLDAKGGAIQGLVPIHAYDKISDVLVEGRLCQISKFNVIAATGGFQIVPHSCILRFGPFTEVKPLDPSSLSIPLYMLRPVPLAAVGTSITASDAVLDVVARIAGFGDTQNVDKNDHRTVVRHMYLIDDRNAVKYGLKTFAGTRFFLDPALPEIAAVSSRYPAKPGRIFTSAASMTPDVRPMFTQGRPSAQPIRISLQELSERSALSSSETFACVAEIVCNTTCYDWFYWSCPQCHHKASTEKDGYKCINDECAADMVTHVPWFRFGAQVADATGDVEFSFIGRHAEYVVGTSAADVATKPNPDPYDALPLLQQIKGRKFLFSFHLKQASAASVERQYTVSRVDPVPPQEPPMQLGAALQHHQPVAHVPQAPLH